MHANPMEQERLEETFKGRGSHNPQFQKNRMKLKGTFSR